MSSSQRRILHRPDLDRELTLEEALEHYRAKHGSEELVASYEPKPLGDWVEILAKPIGCWIDRITAPLPTFCQTRLCGCSACSKRRRFLNLLVPDIRRWNGGWQGAFSRFAMARQDVFPKAL